MSHVFGFNDDELKLLLVAVRQMRRTFATAQKSGAAAELGEFASHYDRLYAKLLDMVGPVPGNLGEIL